LRWLAAENSELALVDASTPWRNGTNESFNGKFRDECLSMEWFRNRVHAKIVIEKWLRQYNKVGPHSSGAAGHVSWQPLLLPNDILVPG
jgi:putative transposase